MTRSFAPVLGLISYMLFLAGLIYLSSLGDIGREPGAARHSTESGFFDAAR